MKYTPTAPRPLSHRDTGFTIVELLITIVVIAILAAITIVSYNGIQKSAIETSLKSDLRSGATQLELYRTTNGTYPSSLTSAGSDLSASQGNTFTYSPTNGDFCLAATTPRVGGLTFSIKGSSGQLTTGSCPPTVATVQTLAGASTYGYTEGQGSAVRFNFYNVLDDNAGTGIDVDTEGNVYIADHGNNVIRKMTPSGEVDLFAGTINGPNGKDNGNIASSNALTASFNYPFDLTIYNDNGEEKMLVIEKCISQIKIDQAPNYPVSIINEDSVAPHDGHYECPYLTNSASSSADGALYLDANSIIVDSGRNAYISEADASKVRKMAFDTNSNWWGTVSNLSPAGNFSYFARLGIDPQDRIYGASSNKIVRFTSSGVRTDFAGTTAAGSADGAATVARFNDPRGVDVDANGNVYVADCGNHMVRKITPAGEVSTIAGSTTAGNVDGQGSAARFYCPMDVAVSADNLTLYVVDGVASGSNIGGYIRKLSL